MLGRELAKQRSDAYFDIYMMMGPQRSIEKLHKVLADSGLRIALNTLKNYSAKHGWQVRLEEAQAQLAAQLASRDVQLIEDMNTKPAQLGAAMQSVSSSKIDAIALDPTQMTPRDAGYLGDVGAKLERLARGEATSRQELQVQVIAPVVQNIVQLFQQVNTIEDPDRRLLEFGLGADRILEQSAGNLIE